MTLENVQLGVILLNLVSLLFNIWTWRRASQLRDLYQARLIEVNTFYKNLMSGRVR